MSSGVIQQQSKLKRKKKKAYVGDSNGCSNNNPAIGSLSVESGPKSNRMKSKKSIDNVPPGELRANPDITNSNDTCKNKVDVEHSTSVEKLTTKASKQKNNSTTASAKPSSTSLTMYHKWQQAAEEMGAKGTQIVLDKSQAKKLVFDLLHDQFKPMNITDIYKALKAIVPSPVLKSCLDEMAAVPNLAINPSENRACSVACTERRNCALLLKEGRNSNTTLYYVDYSKLDNQGNGLLLDVRNTLVTDLHAANTLENELRGRESSILRCSQKLQLESTNKGAELQLKECETEMAQLCAKLEYYRQLTRNEKKRKATQTKIGHAACYWKKRRKICIDFLNMLEDSTEGAISAKKCLSGAGQIEIESDENITKEALELARAKHLRGQRAGLNPNVNYNDAEFMNHARRGDLVAVKLLPNGTVDRLYYEA